MLTALALALAAVAAPSQITVAGATGVTTLAVRTDPLGAPVVSAPQLTAALGGVVRMQDEWVEVVVARQPFRFLVGAPLFQFSNQLHPLANGAWLSSDTVYLPFQFVAEVIPYYLGERYRYDARTARLEDIAARPLGGEDGQAGGPPPQRPPLRSRRHHRSRSWGRGPRQPGGLLSPRRPGEGRGVADRRAAP